MCAGSGNLCGERTVAAAKIEDTLASLGIKQLKDEERWPEGRSPYGLPKVKVVKIVIKKAKKAKEEEAAEGRECDHPD